MKIDRGAAHIPAADAGRGERNRETPGTPKVSVCIPTYNYGHYLPDAVDSVLAQTFADFELLIIDDRSTDSTRELINGYIRKDGRIRYINNASRLGFAGNFSRCVELARGAYVKILCADDLLAPACLEKMVKALDEHPTVSLVACSRQLVDRSLAPLGASSYASTSILLRGVDAARRCFFSMNNRIGEPTAVLFRKQDGIRGFNGEYSLLVDLEMWLYLLEKGDLLFIAEPLCMIRQHEGQATNDCIKTQRFIEDLKRLHDDFSRKEYLHPTFVDRLKGKLGASLNIWNKRRVIDDPELIRKSISRYMNYRLATAVLPAYAWGIRQLHRVRRQADDRMHAPQESPERGTIGRGDEKVVGRDPLRRRACRDH